jgi:hypothetical protein
MYLELAAVWLGQLSEGLTVAGSRPRDQVGHRHRRSTFFVHLCRTSILYRHRPGGELGG